MTKSDGCDREIAALRDIHSHTRSRGLPATDGFELMGKVVRVDNVPVVVLSGYGRKDDVARAFELDASDDIVKPFSPTELVARVKAALKKWRRSGPGGTRRVPCVQGIDAR